MSLNVTESIDKASTMEEAAGKAVTAAANTPGTYMSRTLEGWKEINLIAKFGWEFAMEKDNAAMNSGTTLLEVTKTEGKWNLLIENKFRASRFYGSEFGIFLLKTISFFNYFWFPSFPANAFKEKYS